MPPLAPMQTEPNIRRRYRLRGSVQGVGLRPFVFRLAGETQVGGLVRNQTTGVVIEVEGRPDQVARFAATLKSRAPRLVRIQRIEEESLEPTHAALEFVIDTSADDPIAQPDVTADAAMCEDCLREMLDPTDHRAGYALINCTNCGPRYSIIRAAPYDRPNTTMAGFEMCPVCRAQYASPEDRRFHAQPIACHACGPRLAMVDPSGQPIEGDPLRQAITMLLDGQVLAIKGLGGFHLAVRADREQAVQRLRGMKRRDAKPFAIMCRDLRQVRELVALSSAAEALMQSATCPIVLARRRPGTEERVAASVAPHCCRLGVMLPYTPLQHLLFHGDPRWASPHRIDVPLVMTSANVTDEPLVIGNEEAIERLGTPRGEGSSGATGGLSASVFGKGKSTGGQAASGTREPPPERGPLCDAILFHDRPIERCVDDSVYLDVPGGPPLPIRRSRGDAPVTLILPVATDTPGLCVGGELKNVVALVRQDEAILSQHLGDLTDALAYTYFQRTIDDICRLFHGRPQWIAHDLHPLYLSTKWAQTLARRWEAPLIGVQHHHAHAASVMAEHGVTEPVLAVVCDGVGYGTDGASWGGEVLLSSLTDFTRLAHLRPLRLPGGDAAAKDIRRCGLALLHQALGDDFAAHPFTRRMLPEDGERNMLCAMIQRDLRCSTSTAAGRVFDGVAALLGLCERNRFEAEAPMRMEAAGLEQPVREASVLFRLRQTRGGGPMAIDLSPLVLELIDRLSEGESAAALAALFHDELALAFDAAVARAAKMTGIRTVALSGGVFCNQRLTARLTALLRSRGYDVLRHELVPPGDGGLALGQAAIAAAKVQAGMIDRANV